MKITNYNAIPSYAGQTKTVRTFGAWLGEKPENLQSAVLLKPEYTANMLLDAIGAVYELDTTEKEYQEIQSMSFQWQVSTRRLTKVHFAETCSDPGQGKRDVRIIMDRKYYDKGDTLRLRNGQLLFVRLKPQRIGENRWEHIVTLVTNNLQSTIDIAYMTKGQETIYISNYHPELSERGYSKWTFNAERHKNYISRHRHSSSRSGDYAAMASYTAKVGKTAAKGAEVLEIPEEDKFLFEQFLHSRAGNLLWSVNNFDEAGKCLDQEEDGRDIPMGDGIITQFQRYCDRLTYYDNQITIDDLDDIVYAIADKTGKTTGNIIAFLMNRRAWRSINKCLRDEAKTWQFNSGEHFLAPDEKGGVKGLRLGATFVSYVSNGNVINFMVDESLNEMYPDRGFAIALDAGMNEKGKQNLRLITLKGRKYLSGTLLGMGGMSGTQEMTNLATSVDGSSYHVMGYSGACVHNPYAAVMFYEAIAA